MTLEEFIKESQEDLEKFRKIWRTNHHFHPEVWPLEMGAGEWFEQLLAFISDPTPFNKMESQ